MRSSRQVAGVGSNRGSTTNSFRRSRNIVVSRKGPAFASLRSQDQARSSGGSSPTNSSGSGPTMRKSPSNSRLTSLVASNLDVSSSPPGFAPTAVGSYKSPVHSGGGFPVMGAPTGSTKKLSPAFAASASHRHVPGGGSPLLTTASGSRVYSSVRSVRPPAPGAAVVKGSYRSPTHVGVSPTPRHTAVVKGSYRSPVAAGGSVSSSKQVVQSLRRCVQPACGVWLRLRLRFIQLIRCFLPT